MPLLHDPTYFYQLHDHGLYIAAKRYWLPELISDPSDPDNYTLVLLHSTSFHKETWEPALERLLWLAARGQRDRRASRIKIREAWAFDCPNHGEAGQKNEEKLNLPEFRNQFTCAKYAEAVHKFLSAVHRDVTGAEVNFRKRRLLGIGHSLGSNALLILQCIEPVIEFSSLFIVEPMISPEGPEHLQELASYLVASAYERCDVWRQRGYALDSLERARRTRKWDPRIKSLYVEYALKPHPGGKFAKIPYKGFTLVLSRDEEVAMYRESEGCIIPVAALHGICRIIPIHLILGALHDVIPAEVQDAIISLNTFSSISMVDDVGHLVLQEKPDVLGMLIFKKLSESDIAWKPSHPTLKSKL